MFWIAWAVLMLILPKTRKIGISMLFALILGLLVCNITLKPLVARIRPYDLQAQLGVTIQLLIKRQSDFSFPSGHTIASFEAAVVLLKYSKKMGIPALIIALPCPSPGCICMCTIPPMYWFPWCLVRCLHSWAAPWQTSSSFPV